MMRRGRLLGAHGARTILLIGVLACLCFSAGEGLRLMPISYPAPVEVESPSFRTAISSLNVSLDYQYGTCGLEKSVQKRAQRQQLREGLLISGNGIEHLPVPSHFTADIELASLRSLFPAPQPPGRAPPSA
jgi:hypothetical protein